MGPAGAASVGAVQARILRDITRSLSDLQIWGLVGVRLVQRRTPVLMALSMADVCDRVGFGPDDTFAKERLAHGSEVRASNLEVRAPRRSGGRWQLHLPYFQL